MKNLLGADSPTTPRSPLPFKRVDLSREASQVDQDADLPTIRRGIAGSPTTPPRGVSRENSARAASRERSHLPAIRENSAPAAMDSQILSRVNIGDGLNAYESVQGGNNGWTMGASFEQRSRSQEPKRPHEAFMEPEPAGTELNLMSIKSSSTPAIAGPGKVANIGSGYLHRGRAPLVNGATRDPGSMQGQPNEDVVMMPGAQVGAFPKREAKCANKVRLERDPPRVPDGLTTVQPEQILHISQMATEPSAKRKNTITDDKKKNDNAEPREEEVSKSVILLTQTQSQASPNHSPRPKAAKANEEQRLNEENEETESEPVEIVYEDSALIHSAPKQYIDIF